MHLRFLILSLFICLALIKLDSPAQHQISKDFTVTHVENQLYDDAENILPPPTRASASLFAHIKQSSPEFYLQIEFLAQDWSTKYFKNLIDKGELSPWFVRAQHVSNKARINAWKDTNLLYNTGIIPPVSTL